MEAIYPFIALGLVVFGLIGSFAPVIPGPPLVYFAAILLQWQYGVFSTTFLVLWGIVVLVSVVLDYYLPLVISKKAGASSYGMWGSVIGMFVGIIFTPIGMLMGMFAGAIIGELMAGKPMEEALKSGVAVFVGTLFSNFLKFIISFIMAIFVCIELWKIWF